MQNRKKIVGSGIAAVMIFTAAAMEFSGGKVMICEAKSDDAEKEIVDFVTAYYEAQTPEKIDTLADYVSEPDDMEFQLSLVNLQTTFECGVTGFENINVAAYPLSDGEHWIASVSVEMAVKDFDVAIPGLKVELIDRKPDGDLQIMMNSDELDELEGHVADELLKEIREISLSEEMVDRNNEVAMQYNEIVADDPDVMDWLLEVSEKVDKAKAEAYGQIGQSIYDRKNSGMKEKRYVVKKGDCLWTIAEEQLGDGLFWSDIYETNQAVIGGDPNLIYVGIELELE